MNPNAKKTIQISILALFFLLIVAYALFISRGLIFGVKIREVNLTDGATVKENILPVTGNARHALHLTLNGREISIDQNGNFNETIALLRGYNIINLKAQDKFGEVDEKNYRLVYQPND